MDKGAWWATVPGVAKSDMAEGLSTHTQENNLFLKIDFKYYDKYAMCINHQCQSQRYTLNMYTQKKWKDQ